VAFTGLKPMSTPPSGPFPAIHIHSCSRSPPFPMGFASPMSGPAVNPSRDIATSSTTLLTASLLRSTGAAVRCRYEKVGADPAVSTSPPDYGADH
jgi:hypothetical protein